MEMHVCRNSTPVHAVCLYRPQPSRKNKMTNTMFLNEFPDLLAVYTGLRSDLVLLGDINFHCDDVSDYQVNCLKTIYTC